MQLTPINLAHCAVAQPMTVEQLRHLGTYNLVYLRRGIRAGASVFLILGADGIALQVVSTIKSALAWIADTHLHLVTVH